MNAMGKKDFWERLDEYYSRGPRRRSLRLKRFRLFEGERFSFSSTQKRVKGPKTTSSVYEVFYVDKGRNVVMCFNVGDNMIYPHKKGETDCTAYSFSGDGLNYHLKLGNLKKEGPGVHSGATKEDKANAQRQPKLPVELHSNTKRKSGQGKFANVLKALKIHPKLRARVFETPSEYEWPELPKFPADPIGPQQDLFDPLDDFFEGE